MANARSHSLGPGLASAEQAAGFCYLPFYVFLLSWGLQWAAGLLGLNLTDLQLNVTYFVLNCVITCTIFHRFLLHSLRAIRFWELIQALILGICLYYAGTWVFSWLMELLNLHITSFNDETVLALVAQSRWLMVLCSVVLAPVVEETLVRGLLFGVIRRKSRIAAYIVTIVFFAVLHVWQYLIDYELSAVALAAVQYIPAGIALGWTYEKSNTIWGPIFLHMLINAIAMGILPTR